MKYLVIPNDYTEESGCFIDICNGRCNTQCAGYCTTNCISRCETRQCYRTVK